LRKEIVAIPVRTTIYHDLAVGVRGKSSASDFEASYATVLFVTEMMLFALPFATLIATKKQNTNMVDKCGHDFVREASAQR